MVKKRLKQIGARAVATVVRRRKPAPPTRITNDTISEHRQRILTSGRRFKYPMQYARHKLVINTILLSVGLLIIIAIVGAWQLYGAQNTSGVAYRVTQLLPLPVASVDGDPVRYSDYLMRYRSEIYWLQQNNQINLKTNDGQRQAEYRKRQALSQAEAVEYARHIAQARSIVINKQQVDAFIESARKANGVSISEQAYYSAQYDAYGWSQQEVRDNIQTSLLKREVEFSIDDHARSEANSILSASEQPNADFATIANQQISNGATNVSVVDTGLIPLNSQDASGVISTLQTYNPGQVSGLIRGADGYYIAKLLEKNTTQIHYQYIKVALTEFDSELANLKKQHKINEYIKVTGDA